MFLYIVFFISITSSSINSSHKPLTSTERDTVTLYQRMLWLDYTAQREGQNNRSHTITNAMRDTTAKDPKRFTDVLRWYSFPHLRRNDPETHQKLQEHLLQARTNKRIWKTIVHELPTMPQQSSQQEPSTQHALMRTKTVARFVSNRERTDQLPKPPVTGDACAAAAPALPYMSRSTTPPSQKGGLRTADTAQIVAMRQAQQAFTEAIKCGDIPACQEWLELGAQLNGNVDGETPLQTAIVAAHPDVVEFLVKKGATITEHQKTVPMLYYTLLKTQRVKTPQQKLDTETQMENHLSIHRFLNPTADAASA